MIKTRVTQPSKAMLKISNLLLIAVLGVLNLTKGQVIEWKNFTLEKIAVNAEVVTMHGEQVLKVQRDLNIAPFDLNNVEATVDGPTFLRIKEMELENGTLEVKMLSRVMENSPFPAARGFIGIAFRIEANNQKFESIYLRPANGRSSDEVRRNRAIQYFAFPDYKFTRLRRESPGLYETFADIGLDEWIDVRLEFKKDQVTLYLNQQKPYTFKVQPLLGESTSGSVGLWVDVGTVGYFKDLKISKN